MFTFRNNHRFGSLVRPIPAIALGALLVAAAPADAETYYSRGTGTWNASNAWYTGSCTSGTNDGTYPVAGDTANICSGHTVTVSGADGTAAAAVVDVANSATAILSIESGGVLEVSGSVTVNANGVFRFNAGTPNTAELKATASGVALDGTFCVTGTGGATLSGSNPTKSFAVGAAATVIFTCGGEVINDTTIVVNGGSLTFGGAVTNDGTVIVNSGSTTFSSSAANDGTMIANGATITFSSSVTNDATIIANGGTITFSGAVTNDGTIIANGGTITFSGAVTNDGTIIANGGTITFTGDVENDGTVTASGGDITFSGTVNAGSGGKFHVTRAASDMTFNMSGSATITSGADFNLSAGRLWFQQTLTTDGGYQQTGGTTEVAAGKTFTATGAY